MLELPQSLRLLCVGGNAYGDAAAPVLAQLTQLKELYLSYSPGFTDAGLEQLTNLDLAHLSLYGTGLSEAMGQRGYGRLDLKCDSVKVRTLIN
jgi:hypothetical protein